MSKVTEFAQLRERAKQRRDNALAKIRSEYEEALSQIAALEQMLCGRDLAGKRSISACIDSVIPRDEEFTVGDVMRFLESIDPARVWPIASVRRYVGFLRQKRLIRRVARHNVNQPAVYIRDEKSAERTLNDKPLKTVIAERVTEPMRTMEVVMMLQEAGWTTTMAAEHFRTHVRAALRGAGFAERGGKWVKG